MFKKIIGILLFPIGVLIGLSTIFGIVRTVTIEKESGVALAESIGGMLIGLLFAFWCVKTAFKWNGLLFKKKDKNEMIDEIGKE